MSEKDLAKIKLIYEFNNNSPLFARVAEAYLQEGNPLKAIEILESGIERFPYYTSAKIVLIEALAKEGEYKRVIQLIDKIREDLDEQTVNYYLDKVESEREYQESDQNAQFEETAPKGIEDDLENLADKLSHAKMPKADDSSAPDIKETESKSESKLVSETLAEIYLNQSNYTEALSIYEKLHETNPANKEHYRDKIEQIKNMMK